MKGYNGGILDAINESMDSGKDYGYTPDYSYLLDSYTDDFDDDFWASDFDDF